MGVRKEVKLGAENTHTLYKFSTLTPNKKKDNGSRSAFLRLTLTPPCPSHCQELVDVSKISLDFGHSGLCVSAPHWRLVLAPLFLSPPTW